MNSKNNKKSKQAGKQKGYYKKEVDESLVDNSRKYDISSESEEEAPDFNYLLSQQHVSGSHFVFKNEQEKFQSDNLDFQFSKHFNIDVKLLNLAIKSIPFDERHNINGVIWTDDELVRMREDSKLNENLYKELMSKSEKIILVDKEIVQKVERKDIKEEKKEEIHAAGDDKKSMEKWLDNILDI